MLKRGPLALVLLIVLCGHDLYLKLDTYFLEPNTESTLLLYNGTFEQSDNVIDRDRMLDVSLVGNGSRMEVDTTQWYEEGNTTLLSFKTGESGTWLAGVSTAPRTIEMSASDFNEYLEHDGVLDELALREKNGTINEDAVEKYSKHVKTIFQVGDQISNDWSTPLNYPLEFIPLDNPYELHPSHNMLVQLLWKGKPLANQLVYLQSSHKTSHTHDHDDHEHHHGSEDDHSHDHDHEQQQFRTDADGYISFTISHEDIWYLRTIYLTPSDEEGLTHESNWATLTFEIGSGLEHNHEDNHEHKHGEAFTIPAYAYWLGSFAVVLLLFLWFNRKKA